MVDNHRPGDVLLCKIVPHLVRVWVVPERKDYRQIASGEWILVRSTLCNPHYLRRLLMEPSFREKFMETVSGVGGSLLRARPKAVSRIPIPIAPVNEQRRIVAKLDSLFERTRRVREELSHIPRLIENYKKAILDAAFRGEIAATMKKREDVANFSKDLIDNSRKSLAQQLDCRLQKWQFSGDIRLPNIPNTWRWETLGNLVVHRSGIAFQSKGFLTGGVQVVRLGNLYKGVLDLTRSPVFWPESEINGKMFSAKTGDILISQTGTRYKRDYGHFLSVPPSKDRLLINQRILCITPIPEIPIEYILYFSKTPFFRDFFFSNETGGVNQGNVGIDGVMKAPIPLPPIPVMEEIISVLDKASHWTVNVISDITSSGKLCAILDHRLLDKAFRGELVPQDPNEEPASVLLDCIRGEQADEARIRRGRRGEKPGTDHV